jgi:hypothetical protein
MLAAAARDCALESKPSTYAAETSASMFRCTEKLARLTNQRRTARTAC